MDSSARLRSQHRRLLTSWASSKSPLQRSSNAQWLPIHSPGVPLLLIVSASLISALGTQAISPAALRLCPRLKNSKARNGSTRSRSKQDQLTTTKSRSSGRGRRLRDTTISDRRHSTEIMYRSGSSSFKRKSVAIGASTRMPQRRTRRVCGSHYGKVPSSNDRLDARSLTKSDTGEFLLQQPSLCGLVGFAKRADKFGKLLRLLGFLDPCSTSRESFRHCSAPL